ncbi:biotin-independent malonate decarboxylase subunit beta [Paraburkholderia panacisoli]|jgi:malonate decarboxylase beta subunit|uniref:Biotin-independent malonate decarboxylase subunit beta n=1 Tax=Paraburkholderia panacisoli TaxID=2603818 RepID=A0A5B0GJA4_9BURK|nr:biotin-independent malonate decarboxylase subunit beta [Paraburkholderia panacisoli]KAA1003537.1 biotin-independent malonate decarboxylase subunit beta [Paraburkholderia panacisoli]
MTDTQQLLERQSFIELDARSRASRLLDPGTFRELLDPFDRIRSPWLARQGIVTQADDGTVVAKGELDGQPAVVLAVDGGYQGGSMGEVSAAKIAGSLELAADDNRNGIPTRAVILFETGGVRLQEANLGLAAIAEIHAAIADLRRYQPVIGITAGPIGCYGGMSISAGLCSYLIGTREARLGLNGPAVIEQEAGIVEFDSRDRPMIWSFTGCEQRHRTGLVDVYAADDTDAIRAAVIDLFRTGRPQTCRSERVAGFLQRLSEIDPGVQATPEHVTAIYGKGF